VEFPASSISISRKVKNPRFLKTYRKVHSKKFPVSVKEVHVRFLPKYFLIIWKEIGLKSGKTNPGTQHNKTFPLN